MFTHFQAYTTGADLVEEIEIDQDHKITYVGIFFQGTDETGSGNAIIKRITESIDGGSRITKIEFPEGNDNRLTDTWSERANYAYCYSKRK